MDKDKPVLKEWDDDVSLDQKTAKRIVWRTRLSLVFTVVRTLLIILLICSAYMITLGMVYHYSGKEAGFDRFVTTVIETRLPGIFVDKYAHSNSEISPLLTKKTTLTLYRDVGEWEVVVGEVHAEKTLFGELKLDFQFDHRYLNEKLSQNYAIPPDLLGSEMQERTDHTWQLEQLNKMADGFVVQLQFSTHESMEPEALLNMLQDYDLRVLEMPVYSGELTEFTENIDFTVGGDATFTQTLKLRGEVNYDEQNRITSSIHGLDLETVEMAKEQLYKDLEWLTTADRYSEQEIDARRLQYLQENEIRVFGAVVTGPVREMERLVEENDFLHVALGGIEIWNWH